MSGRCDNTSVGVVITSTKGEIVLLKRAFFPVGIAPAAGHIDDHGSAVQAAIDEVYEELGLIVQAEDLKSVIVDRRVENRCKRPGGDHHIWSVYQTSNFSGSLKPSEDETKGAHWYTTEEVQQLADRTKAYQAGNLTEEEWCTEPGLEEIWLNFFQELNLVE